MPEINLRRRLGFVLPGLAVWGAAVALAQPELPTIADEEAGASWFDHFVKAGGPITWFILIPMSVAMVALATEQFVSIRRKKLLPPATQEKLKELFAERRYPEAQTLAENEPSMLGAVVGAALREAAGGPPAIERAVQERIESRTTRLFRKIEYLNVIGNVSPMVGLFGTVYGMIQAFERLRTTQGVPDASKLAGGISVALVTTFWGLLIAIPALSVYAISRNRIDGASAECALWVDELFTGFSPVSGPAAAAKPAPPKPAAAASPPPRVAPAPPAAQAQKS